MATVYAVRTFLYKKDRKVYAKGDPVEIDDKELKSYLDRKLVTQDKPKNKSEKSDDKSDKPEDKK